MEQLHPTVCSAEVQPLDDRNSNPTTGRRQYSHSLPEYAYLTDAEALYSMYGLRFLDPYRRLLDCNRRSKPDYSDISITATMSSTACLIMGSSR
jgi:hypothetical protein